MGDKYIYIAGRDKDWANTMECLLMEKGHNIVSTWVQNSPEWQQPKTDELKREIATRCIQEINCCTHLIALSPQGGCKGGLWVELGYALGFCKTVYLVGQRTNTMLYLSKDQSWESQIIHCPTTTDLLEKLERE